MIQLKRRIPKSTLEKEEQSKIVFLKARAVSDQLLRRHHKPPSLRISCRLCLMVFLRMACIFPVCFQGFEESLPLFFSITYYLLWPFSDAISCFSSFTQLISRDLTWKWFHPNLVFCVLGLLQACYSFITFSFREDHVSDSGLRVGVAKTFIGW